MGEAPPRITDAEHDVLWTLDRIGSGYGLRIVLLADVLSSTSKSSRARPIKSKGVYVLLHRMQAKGFVRSELVDRDPGERGPRRRVYFVTELGKRVLRAQEAFEGAMREAG